MDLETTQTNAAAKLPLLKQGEYEMWRLRIEQYFQIQDYALWDVIENGNSFKPTARTTANADGTSTSMIPGPVTTEEKAQKKNDVKARSMLLMALPNEHQLTFNQYKDAKTLFAAIQTRFGGNDATKKTQNQLAILGENISLEDLNIKFLRSLPSEWNTHVVVWRNKPDLETMSFDDLYNNFKIVKQVVKRTGTSSSNSSSQNMAFVSTPGSTNEANTINVQVSTANSSVSTDSTFDSTANLSDATVYAILANQPNRSQIVHKDLEQIHEDDLKEMDLKWQLALLSMRARKYYQKTGKKITINGSDTAGYDKSKKTLLPKLWWLLMELVFDWSFIAEEEVTTNMALMDFLDSEKNVVMFCDQIAVLKRDASFKDSEIIALKSEIEKLKKEKECNQIKIFKFENASKCLDKLIRSQISDNSRKGVGYNAVPPPSMGLSAPPTIDLSNSGLEEFQQSMFKGYGSKASKSVCVDTSNDVKKTPDTPLVEELVSKKEKQTIFPKQQDKTATKPVKSFDHVQAHCKYHQRERMVYGNNYNRVNYNYTTNRPHPNAQSNMVPRAVLMKNGLKPFNTVRTVNSAHSKSTVNTTKPMSHFSKSAQSTGIPPTDDQGYVDSGCSRNMTGNISYLSDFQEFDGGYVTFGGGVRGGKITGKGTLKTGKLDFQDVFFVMELQFNLFSVSHMSDKKNCVLFTDIACFVLSPYFKLPDESQILLKISRKNNMCIVDMKNIVPKESLTCLVAKVTLDESMLWHRRLGHINFKTINKLVKDNLVRGLPSKHFENDQTCVACLKGKQHKSSYYSRFTWVFFLASKDETSGILKNFITEIENLVHKKVKIIRYDNGIEFKNRVMNETLIEAAITMLADSKLPITFWAEAINTACYVQNRVKIVKPHNKTPYELFREKPLLKDSDGDDVDVHLYRSMIGSLMYLTSSRPDIMFAVCFWYPRDSPFDLVAYSDSDYAGASLDRKSTTGGCQFLGCRLISWQCKKQTVVATSSTEAEYVAAASCCRQDKQIECLKLNASPMKYCLRGGHLCQAWIEEHVISKVLVMRLSIRIGDQIRKGNATTASSLEAEQDSVSSSMHKTPTRPHDSPLPRVHTLRSDEGSLQQNELIDLVTKLTNRVEVLENDLQQTKKIAKQITDEEKTKIARDAEIAKQLQEESDRARQEQEVAAEANQVHDIDWSDLAMLRYHALQNRSFFKAEVRKNMCIYLKNQGGYMLSHFKVMSYEDIRPIFERVWDQNNAFVPKDSNIEKEKLEMMPEKEELRDRVMDGDLKILLEPNKDVEIWKNQQDYNLISWRLFDSCGIHMLLMYTGIAIHMVIEKKYPLTQEMLSRMLSRRLEVDQESEMAFELLRFIRSQLQK
ncbi:putative ribonuclease H-like domain-containing protein [Tanacetum coccineum]